MQDQFQTIRLDFSTMRRASKARHRDIADKLGVPEGALVAAHVGTRRDDETTIMFATRLRPEWPELLAALEALGEVMALTRNASCVHEKIGVYRQTSHSGSMGLVLGGEIDLRIFYSHWAHGFAVSESTEQGAQLSLQFFDAAGIAIHKIFLKPQSHIPAYQAVCESFASAEQLPYAISARAPSRAIDSPDDSIDIPALHQAWRELRDTHDFFPMLKKIGVARLQALRLAEPAYVRPVALDSARHILQSAADQAVPIMVFVGNSGLIQIHSGVVYKVAVMGPWLNVLDPAFNLHLREDCIDSAWLVQKPTDDGVVSSLEVFDQDGQAIAMFFGERKPGRPELQAWRDLLSSLKLEVPACVN